MSAATRSPTRNVIMLMASFGSRASYWIGSGRSPETVATRRNYRNALSAHYGRLNGRSGLNPTREVVLPPDPEALPRRVSYEVLGAMVPSRTQARLRAMAYLGLRPSEIARIRATDV